MKPELTEQEGEAEHMMDLLLAEAKMHRVGSEQCVLLTDAARLIERLAAPCQMKRKEP